MEEIISKFGDNGGCNLSVKGELAIAEENRWGFLKNWSLSVILSVGLALSSATIPE